MLLKKRVHILNPLFVTIGVTCTGWMKMRWILVLLISIHLSLATQEQQTKGEKCEDGDDIRYPRIFTVIERGEIFINGSRQSASENLGSCRTVEEHVEKMIEYYESFGIDLTPYRENPFSTYTTGDFNIASYAPNPKADYRLVSSTFYEYASAPNTQMTWSLWRLDAKKSLTGVHGEIQPGHYALYGLFRLIENGREICIEYTQGFPTQELRFDNLNPMSLNIHNDDWGYGKLTGLLTVDSSGIVDFRYIMAFPGN